MSSIMRAMAMTLTLLLTACASSHTEPVPHALPVPDRWSTDPRGGTPAVGDWWASFGNAELSTLVGRARDDGFDVAAAEARVRQALANARVAGAPLLPELDASTGARRSGPFNGNASSTYEVGLTARYELDLWARNRASRQAALAALDAAGHDRDAVALIAETETAAVWLATVAATERRLIAGRNLEAASRILALVESRHRAGMASPLDLAQQRGLVASLDQRLAAVDRDIATNHASLAALVGQAPHALLVMTDRLSEVAVPSIPSAMPSTVIARRPDVAAAERRLAAANADVTVARAALLPRITITAGSGFESGGLSRLFDNPLYSLATALAAPIFTGGRLAGERDFAIARREEILTAYRRTIVTAFADVEQALAAIETLDREREKQAEVLRQAEIATRLAESRYRAGAETLLTMLDAQRTLYAAQENALTLRQARLGGAITLYRALGGRDR